MRCKEIDEGRRSNLYDMETNTGVERNRIVKLSFSVTKLILHITSGSSTRHQRFLVLCVKMDSCHIVQFPVEPLINFEEKQYQFDSPILKNMINRTCIFCHATSIRHMYIA